MAYSIIIQSSIVVLVSDIDPSAGTGIPAAKGSLCSDAAAGVLYFKSGDLDTDWQVVTLT